jgi:hypothetical protein
MVTEDNRRGLPAVFSADPNLQVRPGFPSFICADPYKLSDARLVQNLEWIILKDPVFQVKREKLPGIIPRNAVSGLRKIIGAERKELRDFRYAIRGKRSARKLDHGAYEIIDALPGP